MLCPGGHRRHHRGGQGDHDECRPTDGAVPGGGPLALLDRGSPRNVPPARRTEWTLNRRARACRYPARRRACDPTARLQPARDTPHRRRLPLARYRHRRRRRASARSGRGPLPDARAGMVRLWEDLDLGPRSASIILLTLGRSHTWADGLHRRLRTGDPGGSALLGAAWPLAVVFRFCDRSSPGGREIPWRLRTANAARTADLWLRVVVTLALAVTAAISLGAEGADRRQLALDQADTGGGGSGAHLRHPARAPVSDGGPRRNRSKEHPPSRQSEHRLRGRWHSPQSAGCASPLSYGCPSPRSDRPHGLTCGPVVTPGAMRCSIKTAPMHTTWKTIRDVWVEADGIEVFDAGWTFNVPIAGDPAGPVWRAGRSSPRRPRTVGCGSG